MARGWAISGIGERMREAVVRRVVAEELRPVQQALARLETVARHRATGRRLAGWPHARAAVAAPEPLSL